MVLFALASFSAENVWSQTLSGWLPLLALALVSHIGGQGLITLSVAKLSAATASIGLLVQPIAAAIMASAILFEPISKEQVIGGVIILAGISLTQVGDDLKRHFQTRWFTSRRKSAFA